MQYSRNKCRSPRWSTWHKAEANLAGSATLLLLRRVHGKVGGGNGCRETAIDESRKETGDRVARYQADYHCCR